MKREELRNLAIIAHVDHGKTTLVDALFHQGGIYRENQATQERAMDSNDQERERGITILAKATSVQFGDITFQIVDTPGHADFGGEVERTLRMVDGVLLLVDAAEGPLPQTRFVLSKALALGLAPVVAINKIDRQDARPEEVLQEVYDLFIDLGANEEQLDFPVLYAVARDGIATRDLSQPGTSLQPLVEVLKEAIPPPKADTEAPFVMQVNQLGFDNFVGRLVIGRILQGTIQANTSLAINSDASDSDKTKTPPRGRVTGLFRFEGVRRIDLKEAKAGDIVALAGIENIRIGDTLSHPDHPTVLPAIKVDEPTVAMVFQVNDGPLSGKSGGKFLTSRQLRERLHKEAYANPSIAVEDGETPDQFRVLGRGELQLAVLVENLRRESFELCVRNPQVVTREVNGQKEEPTELLRIDVPSIHLGATTELVGKRNAILRDQTLSGDRTILLYVIPTRGLFGLRNLLMTATRGTAIAFSQFEGWIAWTGPLKRRSNGALVADRAGKTTPYALFALQARGILMIPTGTEVYEGMIIGEHTRENDLNVNCVREKNLTNVRASGKDDATKVSPHREMPLERCLEWICPNEMVEVTPDGYRMRKIVLAANKRPVRQSNS